MKKIILFLALVLSSKLMGQNIINSLEGIVNFYPIRYDDGMEVFVTLNNETINFVQLRYKSIKKPNWQHTDIVNGRAIIKGFDLDDVLEIYLTSPSGEINKNEPIYVHSQFDDLIEVGSKFYKRLINYIGKQNQELPIYTFLQSLVDQDIIHEMEAVSYLQQFYFEELTTIPRNSRGGDRDEIILVPGSSIWNIINYWQMVNAQLLQKCNCRFIMNHANSMVPISNWNTDAYNYQGIGDELFTNASTLNIDGDHTHMIRQKGPAHYHNFEMAGWSGDAVYNYTELGIEEINTQGGPNFATVNYTLACQEGAFPRECGCEKKINFRYYYYVEHNVYGQKPWAILSNGQRVGIENTAIAFIRYADGQIEVIQGSRMLTTSACSTTLNSEFFANIVELAAAALGIYIDFSAMSEEDADILEALGDNLDNVTSTIQNMITTPLYLKNGECSVEHEKGTLLNGQRIVTLIPNKSVELMITSFTRISARGYQKWELSADTKSQFYIGGIVQPGYASTIDPNINSVWCCTDKIGHYVKASYIPNGDQTTSQILGVFYSDNAPWDNAYYSPSSNQLIMPVNQNFGKIIWTNPNSYCAETNGRIAESTINELEQTNNQISVLLYPNPASEVINIEVQGVDPQLLSFRLIDITGRAIDIEVNFINAIHQLRFPMSINSGTYVLQIYQENILISQERLIVK